VRRGRGRHDDDDVFCLCYVDVDVIVVGSNQGTRGVGAWSSHPSLLRGGGGAKKKNQEISPSSSPLQPCIFVRLDHSNSSGKRVDPRKDSAWQGMAYPPFEAISVEMAAMILHIIADLTLLTR
jgi:hypothetical protein